MDQSQFKLPVRLIGRPGEPVTEIYSAEEAFEFLLNFPVQEDPIYESALEACFVATIHPEFCDEARMGLATFAKAHGVLVQEGLESAPIP